MKNAREQNSEVNFWPAYSDLAIVMVLLLLLFLLTEFVMHSRLLINQTFAIVENEALHAARRKMAQSQERIETLFAQASGVASIVVDGNLQTFTFSADVLFPKDEAVLSPQGEDLLRRFGSALKQQGESYKRIEIEGHADERPSQKFFRRGDVETDHGNWRLSAERAITVAQLFQRLSLAGSQLAVVGRSFYEPASSEGQPGVERSEELRARDRRISIRLFYSEARP